MNYISMSSFPKDEYRRKLWMLAVRRKNWHPTRCSKLCSQHFPEEMIDRTSLSCVRLRENAVPSVFNFLPRSQKMSGSYCCVPGCKERGGTGISMHEVPSNFEIRKKWLLVIPRDNWIPNGRYSQVCSRHFTQGDFKQGFKKTLLNKTAVPSIFPTYPEKPAKKKTRYATAIRKRKNDSISSQTYEEKAAATSSEKSEPNFEPEIVIKEEPIDIDEEQLPSTSRTGDEFILPWTPADTPSTSQHTPTLGVAFTVCKTEVTDDQEDAAKKTSNGNPKASKKKAGKGVVEQCEKRPRESEEDSAKDRPKDHFDAYGEYIAAKLRKLDWKSCAYVQKAIGDIIFEAEMGKYKQ